MSVEVREKVRLCYLEDQDILEVRIPVRWHKRKGRKSLSVPGSMYQPKADEALRVALIQAYRWQRKVLSQQAKNVKELSLSEQVDKSYLSKMKRLTALAPDIQSDILHERGQWPLSLAQLMKPFPLAWEEQREHFTGLCRLDDQPPILSVVNGVIRRSDSARRDRTRKDESHLQERDVFEWREAW